MDRPPRRERRITAALLIVLVAASFVARAAWLSKPEQAIVFDEKYYVNAARVIAHLHPYAGAPYADATLGPDPNTEHPPLGKIILAVSMSAFGDTPLGWRFPSVALGTLSVLLLYGITRRLGGAPRVALSAAFIYSFDNLVLVHSRIATLDTFVVAFLLLGFYAYMSERPVLAAVAFVAGALCKITGLYGVGGLVAFELVRAAIRRRRTGAWDLRLTTTRPLLITTLSFVVGVPIGLALLDYRFSTYRNPFAHVGHMLSYGLSLARPGGPQGEESTPWQWLVNDVQMTYFRVDAKWIADGVVERVRPTIFFRGAMNPFVVMMLPIALGYAITRSWRAADRLSLFVLATFAAAYLPFFPMAIVAKRICYIFYFLPALPALAIGIASALQARGVPRAVWWAYFLAVAYGFYEYYPIRPPP